MLTRKHFNEIARLFADAKGADNNLNAEEMRQHLALQLCRFCADQNPNFDPQRFMDACNANR